LLRTREEALRAGALGGPAPVGDRAPRSEVDSDLGARAFVAVSQSPRHGVYRGSIGAGPGVEWLERLGAACRRKDDGLPHFDPSPIRAATGTSRPRIRLKQQPLGLVGTSNAGAIDALGGGEALGVIDDQYLHPYQTIHAAGLGEPRRVRETAWVIYCTQRVRGARFDTSRGGGPRRSPPLTGTPTPRYGYHLESGGRGQRWS